MKFNPDEIVTVPVYATRGWDSCNYIVNGKELFHERTYFPYSPFKPVHSVQWMPGVAEKTEIEKLAAKHGGEVIEHFYAPEGSDCYFLAFRDNDKAVAFCQTADYDALVLTEGKIGE